MPLLCPKESFSIAVPKKTFYVVLLTKLHRYNKSFTRTLTLSERIFGKTPMCDC